MKGIFFSVALLVVCVSGFAQGTLNFANSGPGLSAMVFDTDGVTPLSNQDFTNYVADLYWTSGVTADSTQLSPLNTPASFSSDPTQAGFFFGGPRTIPLSAGSTITAQVRVWRLSDGPSWTSAAFTAGSETGESIVFQVTLADPTTTPTIMTNLNGNPWRIWPTGYVLDIIVTVQDIGVRSNQFGFTIVPWTDMRSLVIEAATNLSNPIWIPVQTNNYISAPFYFSDPEWTNYPTRFYRFPHYIF